VLVNVLVGRLHAMPWWRGVMGFFNAHERSIALEALERAIMSF
jgi:phosphonate transport system ATP-binding protein